MASLAPISKNTLHANNESASLYETGALPLKWNRLRRPKGISVLPNFAVTE